MLGDDPFENKHPRTTATTSSGSGSRAVFLDEGIPSKAIWDPSSSVSDSSSVASIASISVASVESNHIINSSTDEYLDHHHQQQQREPQGPGNSVPYSAPTEHNLRMRIYNDDNNNDGDDRGGGTSSNNYDDDRLSAMLTNSINSAHARSNDTSIDVGSSSNINEMILPTPLRDERHRFIQSLSHLTDKQLRTRLWDSFRLARIILGKPVKEKRRLSHKSILHAIRKVAEMKIHIVNLSKELDGYRQHEKKASIAATTTTRSNNNDEQKQQAAGIGTNEEKDNPNNKSIDSMSVSMSSYATVSSFTASVTSVRDVISDSNSTDRNVSNLREEALRILKEEADQALDQLHEFELLHLQDEEDTGSGPSGPSPVRDGGNDESNNNNADPVSLFLSPSNSIEDDDAVYADDFSHDDEGNESASDILEAFRETGTTTTRAQQQSQQQQEANRPLPMNTAQQQQQQQQKSTQASRVASFPAVVAKSSSSSSDKDEILRVLGHVKALQQTNQQGINREIPSSASAVHEEVIALLTRLAQNQTPPQKTSVVSIGTKHETQDVFEDDEEEDDDDDDEELTFHKEQLFSAKAREAEHFEQHRHLTLQKKLLMEDIAVAKESITPERRRLQLERLHSYKSQVSVLVDKEEERKRWMTDLDTDLNRMSLLCVKLEDGEAAYRAKHEAHLKSLRDCKSQSKIQTDHFRSLLANIDREIEEQSVAVFGKTEQHKLGKKGSVEDRTGAIIETGSEDSEASAEDRIQKLEYLLARQKMELFNTKAQLKLRRGRGDMESPRSSSPDAVQTKGSSSSSSSSKLSPKSLRRLRWRSGR
mmetsp:Transcript_29994/g.62705  ORF Transcript_29994/g.62705 Transcript_29994/m.62705 type:complete len:820 (-) Transcript_29994:8-2467(-)